MIFVQSKCNALLNIFCIRIILVRDVYGGAISSWASKSDVKMVGENTEENMCSKGSSLAALLIHRLN